METTIGPVCTACGCALGHVYPAYYRILTKRIKDTLDKHRYSYQDQWDNIETDMGDVLDKLCVMNLCCRTRMMSHSRTLKGSL